MRTTLTGRRPALRRWALTGAALCAALTVSPAAAGAAPLGTNGAATPALSWAACGPELTELDPGFQCATARVPLDYRSPSGSKIDVAVSRLRATGPGTRLGSVFINPGGPGAGGRDAATFATANLRSRFDIIGFDPRGTGASAPVRCTSSDAQTAALLAPPFPLTASAEAITIGLAAQGTSQCGRNAGPVLSHMSTANVARDLDLLRKSVGDAKLNFLGFSYGSVIGETYANIFTSTSRALVLDGVVDPVRFLTGRTATEATQPLDFRAKSYVGTNEAVTAFLNACAAAPGTCAFATPGATGTTLRTKFNAMLARVRANNGVVVDGETLSYQDVIGMIYGDLNYGIFTSIDLAGALEAIDQASRDATRVPAPSLLQQLRDALALAAAAQTPGAGAPADYDNFLDAFLGVVCSDADSPKYGYQWPAFSRTSDQEVPGFGPFWVWTTLPCATWPVKDPDRYTGPFTAKTTTPVLLVGNKLGDPSTRYAGAVQTASTLGNARLLSVNVYGHTAYGLTGSCVDDTVDAYITSLTVPPAGKVCEPDFGPFDAAAEEAADVEALQGYPRSRTFRPVG